jgi:hypothetical protein
MPDIQNLCWHTLTTPDAGLPKRSNVLLASSPPNRPLWRKRSRTRLG